MFRSTKGASKQRRDLINSEISILRDLLPLPESARQRLSQLQIMSLACVYIRKCNFFSRLFGEGDMIRESPYEFSQTMTGFLIVVSRDGKLLYISENVTEYLGHSMVDMMTQGDSVYDIIDKRDHSLVQNQLMSGPSTASSSSQQPHQAQGQAEQETEERTFFCRMNVARSFRRQAGFGDHKMMHVKGHFMQPMVRDHYGNQSVFMAMCSPLITPDVKDTTVQNSTTSFYSVHGLDMKFTEIGHIGQHHLGYTEAELVNKSWYELLHPEDLHEAKEKHIQLIKSSHEMGCMLTTRLQSKFGSWIWVNVVMHIRQPFVCDNGEPAIVCINHVIDDAEAQHFKLQSQLYSSHIAGSPVMLGSQGSSPQHTITQVPVEPGSSYPSQSYTPRQAQAQAATEDLQGLLYSVDFLASTSTLGSLTQTPSTSEEQHAIFQGTGGLYVDSSSNSSAHSQGSSTDQKQFLRADVVNKLKRKISESSNGQQQCRPNKITKIVNNGNHGGMSQGHGSSYQASALIANASLFESLGSSFSGLSGSGDIQVFTPTQEGPVYQQLVLKKDALLYQTVPSAEIFSEVLPDTTMKPPTPLTPDSLCADQPTSDYSTQDQLTISISDSITIPSSLLTPDASPVSISSDEMCASPSSQYDQSLENSPVTELTDVSFFDDSKTTKKNNLIYSPKAVIKKDAELKNTTDDRLPIIDSLSLEKMLCDLEQKPAEVPASAIIHAQAQPEICEAPRSMEARSFTQSPEPSEQQLLNQAVTNTLMDMVQQAAEGTLDLSQFMVPSKEGDQPVIGSTDSQNLLLKAEADGLAGLGTFTVMAASQEMMSDDDFTILNQLSEMGLPPPPPYSDCDLPSSLFA